MVLLVVLSGSIVRWYCLVVLSGGIDELEPPMSYLLVLEPYVLAVDIIK